MQKELQAHTLQYKAEGAYDLQRKELQGRLFRKGGGSEASERLKRGEGRIVASDSKHIVAGKLLVVKNNQSVIRMGVSAGTQWGASWRIERVCGRGAIRTICGKVFS
jgi:hypothetical protein